MPTLEPISVEGDPYVALPVDAAGFPVRLEVFEGPLQLLLQLIESRRLDVLTVPLAEIADAYLDHIAHHPVEAANLSEFVAIAAQLIYLKSKRLLPAEPFPSAVDADAEEPDEEALRRRLIEYRALRDAAIALGERDGVAPALRREPREADLPEPPSRPLAARLLADALATLAAIPEPGPPPPEVVPREVSIGQQMAALHAALSRGGRLVLQAFLAGCRTRAERTVTFMAALELVRRREVRAKQSKLFGPIVLERSPESAP